jgi:hypothetical protein
MSARERTSHKTIEVDYDRLKSFLELYCQKADPYRAALIYKNTQGMSYRDQARFIVFLDQKEDLIEIFLRLCHPALIACGSKGIQYDTKAAKQVITPSLSFKAHLFGLRQ